MTVVGRDFFRCRSVYCRAGAVNSRYAAIDVVRSTAGSSSAERGQSAVATQQLMSSALQRDRVLQSGGSQQSLLSN